MAARYGALACAVATPVLIAIGLALGNGTLGGLDGSDRTLSVADAVQIVSIIGIATVGLVVALRRPGNPIGWIFSAIAVLSAVFNAVGGYAVHTIVVEPGSLPGGEWAAWFRHWADRSTVALVLLAFLLFPSGHAASPRWRPALLLPVLVALGFATRGLVPGPLGFLHVPNPMGVEWVPTDADDGRYGGIPFIVASLVAAAQLIVRYRQADATEREQIKWLALPLGAFIVALLATLATFLLGIPADIGVNGPAISSLYSLAELLLPVCMAIAILRYRLYDIDVLINRALVYAALSAVLAAAYVAGVAILESVLAPFTSGSGFAVAISTLGVLALFQPLRRRIQEAVDRRFYRARYDAARTLDDFSARLRDEVDLDAVRADLVSAVRETVQPAHASVWLRR